MANNDEWLSHDPRSWTAAQRAAAYGQASLIPLFPSWERNPRILSFDRDGNTSAPGPNAKPELVLPAAAVDEHPCEALNLRELLNTGKLPQRKRYVNLGLISQVAARKSCPLCQLVQRGFGLASKALLQIDFGCLLYSRPPEDSNSEDLHQLEVFAAPLTLIAASLSDKKIDPYFILRIHCIRADDNGEPKLIGGRFRNREIDFDLAGEWISNCIEQHDECKSDQHGINSTWKATLKLIDVDRRCVVRAPSPIPRYLALSYVWGPPELQRFRSTVANTTEMDPNTDVCMQLPDHLPPTIEDAIAFVKGLSEKYLWVDSLCIVQDSMDKANQINQMEQIYSAALATLVAAAGSDVNAGLSGVRQRSRPEQIVAEFQSINLAILPASFIHVHNSVWTTRGWTYQEKLLSRRIFFFSEGDLLFICNCSMAREDLHGMKQIELGNITKSLGDDAVSLGNPLRALGGHLDSASNECRGQALAVYMEMIHHYTSRKLTNAEDILRAIQGILNQTQGMLGNCTDGIPVAFLEAGLLWQMDGAHNRRSVAKPAANPLFPSWSWAGWIGRVKYDSIEGSPQDIQTKIGHLQIVGSSGMLEHGIMPSPAEDKNISADPKVQNEHKHLDQAAHPLPRTTILKFVASFATFRIKDPRKLNTAQDIMHSILGILRQPSYWIVDAADNPIGEITLSTNWAQSNLQSSVTFIALSMRRKFSPPLSGWVASQPKVTLSKPSGTSGDNGISFPPPLAEWETINVIAVEQLKCGVFERRGLGAIHLAAWEATKPLTRSFLLA